MVGFYGIHPMGRPYLRAIAEWVEQPESPYRLVTVYHSSDNTAPRMPYRFGDGDRRGFTIQLYVKRPEKGMLEGSK